MFRFARLFSADLSCRRPSRHRPKAVRPTIEALADRDVPAVLFQPVFGPENTSIVGTGIMSTTHIYPILWGATGGATRKRPTSSSPIGTDMMRLVRLTSSPSLILS